MTKTADAYRNANTETNTRFNTLIEGQLIQKKFKKIEENYQFVFTLIKRLFSLFLLIKFLYLSYISQH